MNYQPILYWGDTTDLPYRHMASVRYPSDWINNRITWEDRILVGDYLASGESLLGYMGYADCRICGDTLGTRDFTDGRYVWPELAEHYILTHDIWTPECGLLLKEIYDTKTK